MKQANKLTTRKSRVQGKHRTAGYKVVKHKSSDVSFSATKAVTKSSYKGEVLNRCLAAYVCIEKQQDDKFYLTSPPSSSSSRLYDHTTRSTAFQTSSQHSEIESSHERLAPRIDSTHSWTFIERQALCLYKRIYENDFRDLAALMNSVFPAPNAPFNMYMLLSQHSNLKGWHYPTPRALAAYASVWKHSFEQLDAIFAFRIARATVQATSIGIELKRRSNDAPLELSAAKHNRQRHPSMFREQTFDENDDYNRETTPMSLAGDDPPIKAEELGLLSEAGSTPSMTSPSHIAPARPTWKQHSNGYKTKTATTVLSSQSIQHIGTKRFCTPCYPIITNEPNEMPQFESKTLPALLFRSVGQTTAGASSERFIYSGRHAPFAGRPIHVPKDHEVMLDDCELHVGRHEVHSSMISTTQSLIWALMKCNHLSGDSSSKYLYVIDATAAHSRTRVFAGHVLARELRAHGRLQPSDIRQASDSSKTLTRCRYTGYYDYLVYGEVSGPGIVKRVSQAQLERLAKSCPHVGRFLRLHLFENIISIKRLFEALAKEPVTLDSSAGTAIARVLLLLGVKPQSASEVVHYCVYTMLQNWQIKLSSARDSLKAAHAFVEKFVGDLVVQAEWARLERCAREAITRWASESCKTGSRKWPFCSVRW